MKIIKLTDQEVDDLKKALVIAMKTIDETTTGKGSDMIFADRLEVLENKLAGV
ncbi:hypothetical protein [Pedobacter zeae]|uniref:Uncharacterized protein n=1 Tax=Pedobacter zeae TaxID=1737356 RepID=A0A7W6KBV2_9SPHI|nr:hypothetical protein [Pedobacter zeae]MBB4107732.1 hypothetical protein [Pedobacter zeae]GGG97423.1 hypothetical protein GCM10007422_09220 [Pedobacter zeae]